ncbi:uncharacterized protein A4U43_C06F11940 [Asparagus officinalis]|uniref:Hyaluronan/mRNA-binding protein domain-containing protein n=1 Tax=Asparagus officinalis TaxID=4686 RepID=A0A5P1ELA7_ASPOF|nr:uncharacterized protein A4U43_C06F11940 [Asparagus officinalis]
MTTVNPFDLLGDDDNDDPSQLIAAAQQQEGLERPAAHRREEGWPLLRRRRKRCRAVREARNPTSTLSRGGDAGRGGPGRGRGGRGAGVGPNRDFGNGNENGFTGGYGGGRNYGGGIAEEGEGGNISGRNRGGHGPPRESFRGGRRGGYGNGDEEAGDSERPPRRVYERRSGTGRGYEIKREGAGRGNWGTVTDVVAQELEENVNADEIIATAENQPEQEDGKPVEGNKDNKENTTTEEEAKPEDKEMTLDEYEKVKEEKRKSLLAMKAEERKVTIDKELESMKQLSLKKGTDEIFIKLGSDKESKKKETEREERAKKSLSINEFLKPAEGERYNSGGRGRGRGRGDRGGRGGFGGGGGYTPAPAIEDPGQFPTLGGK